MQGGYAYQPWVDSFAVDHPPTNEFLFRNRHRQPLSTAAPPTYQPTDYPYVCCELGGGMQAYYNVRPVVPAHIPQAMAVVALGSGSNLIGYYMYHGGSHPVGTHSYLNEYRCPRISYDYQAPIGEYGQCAALPRAELLHLFIEAYGGTGTDAGGLARIALPPIRLIPNSALRGASTRRFRIPFYQ